MSDPTPEQTQFQQTINQINELAQKLQRMSPGYSPPPFAPEEMVRLLRDNIDRFTPQMRVSLLKELQSALPGPQARDLLNIETWKGMWFVANQAAQEETRSVYERLSGRLSKLPGAQRFSSLPGLGLVSELGGMLEGSEPKDFLDIDTWKGLWFLLNYSLQNEATALKTRFFGEAGDDDEEEIEILSD